MKKVKKFGRGGDIITGLGAVLVGKALYDKYKEGKGADKDDDYTRRVKEFGRKGDFPDAKKEEPAEPVSITKKEPSAGEKRAAQQSKDPKSLLVPEGADKDVLYESDKALTRTGDNKRKPVVKPKARPRTDAAPKAVELKAAAPKTVEPKTSTSKEGFGKIKPLGGESPAAKTMRESRAQRMGTNYNAQYKALQSAPEGPGKEALKKSVEKAKQDYDAAVKGMRKGGAVKASKMGSVKTAKPTMRSASKRADGIAIRGKTRA